MCSAEAVPHNGNRAACLQVLHGIVQLLFVRAGKTLAAEPKLTHCSGVKLLYVSGITADLNDASLHLSLDVSMSYVIGFLHSSRSFMLHMLHANTPCVHVDAHCQFFSGVMQSSEASCQFISHELHEV